MLKAQVLVDGAALCWLAALQVMVRLDLALGRELGSRLLHEYCSAAQAEGQQ